MKTISLTQNKVALVDDSDYDRVSKFKWYAARYNHLWYAQREMRQPDGTTTTVKLHQFILPNDSGQRMDHKDGDGLNCQKYNLRFATGLQNGSNKRKTYHKKSSRFKGVFWARDRKLWRAMIRVENILIHLGQFEVEETAARAYDTAAQKYFGEFSCTNFK